MSTATLAEAAVNPRVIAPAEPMETDDALYETVHGQRLEMPPMSILRRDDCLPNRFGAERVRQAEATRRGIHGTAHPPAFGRGRESRPSS